MNKMCKMTKNALKDRRGSQEVCLYFSQQHRRLAWCKKDDIREECKRFYKFRKEGLITMLEENNGQLEMEGQTFYYFVVQHTDEDNDQIDPFAMANGLMVEGFVYFFTRSANRDALYKYIMGIKNE